MVWFKKEIDVPKIGGNDLDLTVQVPIVSDRILQLP